MNSEIKKRKSGLFIRSIVSDSVYSSAKNILASILSSAIRKPVITPLW
jgi:hypothetical protein